MLIRLWWKEWRSLAPIMATLVISAAALHWFLLTYGGRDIRNGILIPIAVGFAVVYALVAGAASFAGERENRTMGFLDALPVGRSLLWLGKASFALVSSVLLGLLLRWGSLIGWKFEDQPFAPIFNVDLFFGLLLVEAAIWGLLWSSLTKNALTAGILGVLTTGASTIVQGLYFATREPGKVSSLDVSSLILWVGLLGIVLLISWAVLELELPIQLRPRMGEPRTAPSSLLSILANPRTLRESIRPGSAFLSVAWQTFREGRATWLQTLGIGLIVPFLSFLAGGQGLDLPSVLFFCAVALLIQGISVFGLENSAGTRHFLDNQAVPPGTVWASKVVTWACGLAAFFLIVVVASLFSTVSSIVVRLSGSEEKSFVLVLALVAALPNAFAVGMVGGMIFNRRITAAMISLMALILVMIPQVALVSIRLIPLWSLLLSPLILILVSRLWAGDWLANRGGLRPWLKLGALIAVPFGGLMAIYVVNRAFGVADVGPRYGRAAQTVVSPKLIRSYQDVSNAIVPGSEPGQFEGQLGQSWSNAPSERVECLKRNLKVVEMTRQAAARSAAVIDGGSLSDYRTLFSRSNQASKVSTTLRSLSTLLEMDSQERRSRGDFFGAWNDILAQFQMSDQYASAARSMADYEAALWISQAALNRALAWSRDPKVTLEAIRFARTSLETVAVVPTAADALRGESWRIEISLDHPTEEWVDFLAPENEVNPFQPWTRIFDAWAVAPGWERERTRRIIRMVGMIAIRNASLDRGSRLQESSSVEPFWPPSRVALWNTPLANRLVLPFLEPDVAYDRESTNRRALELFLALRAWQLTHDGNAPASLSELVPAELSGLPSDPYSMNKLIFRYANPTAEVESVDANGVAPAPQPGMPGMAASAGAAKVTPDEASNRPPQYLLYSVGPNNQDDLGRSDDLGYLLPANPPPQPK